LAFSPDGKMLATWNRLWAVDSGLSVKALPVSNSHFGATAGPTWSPDGKRLAFGQVEDGKGALAIYEAASGTLVKRWDFNDPFDLRWSPDGKTLAALAVGAKVVQLLDPETGKVLREIPHARVYRCAPLAWSPDSKTLACTEGVPGGWPSMVVKLWPAGKPAQVLSPGGYDLAWSPDSKTVAVGGQDAKLRLWDAASGTQVRTIESGDCGSLAWSVDGKTLAATGPTLPVRLFDVTDGRQRAALLMLPNEQWLAVDGAGHYRGNVGIEQELVYIVQTGTGQETLTPAEFATKYAWKNDPEKVRLQP
jgi:Tol biopolymer transport system component